MLRGKGLLVLVVITAIAVAGAVSSLRQDSRETQVGELVFPALLERVNDVNRVVVSSGGERFTLAREGNTWVAPDRGGFPVAPDKVHRLLVGAAGLRRLEPKTSNPERFEELGLRDPALKESRAVGFELHAADGAPVANLVVGERRPAKGDPSRTEYFVRTPGDERSWLVIGTLPHDADTLADWLRKRIAEIPEDRIARVRVTHADGEVVTAVRKPDGAPGFDYRERPAGATVKDPWRVNDLGRLLSDLSLEEVRPAAGDPGNGAKTVVETATRDGLRVTLRLGEDGSRALAWLSAEFDPALAQEFSGTRAQGAPDEAAVRQEAAALNARWQGWVYVLPDHKADSIRYRQADSAPPAQPGGEGSPPAAPSG